MLWICGGKDGQQFDDLITSTSTTGRPTPDFENLGFKIASGLGKILSGNFKKQDTKAQLSQKRDHLQADRFLG